MAAEGQPPPESNEPITQESVLKAERQTEDAWVQLMNQMERSVQGNGEFFIELGDSSTNNGISTDTRALLLIEGKPMESRFERDLKEVVDDGNNDSDLDIPGFLKRKPPQSSLNTRPDARYMVITKKGPKIVTLSGSDFERLSEAGRDLNQKGGFFEATHSIGWGRDQASDYQDLPDDDEGEKFYNEALTNSIEVSRKLSKNAENKRDLDAAQQEQARAQRFEKLFSRLTQPTANEG